MWQLQSLSLSGIHWGDQTQSSSLLHPQVDREKRIQYYTSDGISLSCKEEWIKLAITQKTTEIRIDENVICYMSQIMSGTIS